MTRPLDTLTTSFADSLLKSLQDPAEARLYIDVAFDEFQRDGDLNALRLAVDTVLRANELQK